MKQSCLFIPLAVLALFLLFPLRVQAQHTYSYSSIDYDESTNIVSGYAQTNEDYSTAGVYGTANVSSKITDGYGTQLAQQSSQGGTVSFTVAGDGSDSYTITSGHYIIASFVESNYYSQCDGQYYSFGFIDYYNYEHFTETPSTPDFYPSYDNFGPGPNCPVESADFVFGETIATVGRPTLTGVADIWWFNGSVPNGYYYSSPLTASPPNKASYKFKIVSGTDKAGLGPNNVATYNTSANSAILYSTSYSLNAGDVSVTVTVGHWTSVPFNITIHTAWVDSQRATPTTTSNATYGYLTTYYYWIWDQFGNLLPVDIPMNEYFPDGWVNDDTTTTWNPLPPNGTMTFESSFDDHYGGAGSGGTPPATGPCQPFCNHLVQHAAQEYRAGDVQPGVGFRMQTDTIYKYTDHGYVNNIVSPAPSPAP